MKANEIFEYLNDKNLIRNDDVYYSVNKYDTLIVNDVYIHFLKIDINVYLGKIIIDNGSAFIPFDKIRSIEFV